GHAETGSIVLSSKQSREVSGCASITKLLEVRESSQGPSGLEQSDEITPLSFAGGHCRTVDGGSQAPLQDVLAESEESAVGSCQRRSKGAQSRNQNTLRPFPPARSRAPLRDSLAC